MTNKQPKTTSNNKSVPDFLKSIDQPQRRQDAITVCQLMKDITRQAPRMWGDTIVGFGRYHYKYASGREGDWMRIGFSPRKASLTIYLMDGCDRHKQLLSQLGPHKTSISCLYIQSIQEIDVHILRQIIKNSYQNMALGLAK